MDRDEFSDDGLSLCSQDIRENHEQIRKHATKANKCASPIDESILDDDNVGEFVPTSPAANTKENNSTGATTNKNNTINTTSSRIISNNTIKPKSMFGLASSASAAISSDQTKKLKFSSMLYQCPSDGPINFGGGINDLSLISTGGSSIYGNNTNRGTFETPEMSADKAINVLNAQRNGGGVGVGRKMRKPHIRIAPSKNNIGNRTNGRTANKTNNSEVLDNFTPNQLMSSRNAKIASIQKQKEWNRVRMERQNLTTINKTSNCMDELDTKPAVGTSGHAKRNLTIVVRKRRSQSSAATTKDKNAKRSRQMGENFTDSSDNVSSSSASIPNIEMEDIKPAREQLQSDQRQEQMPNKNLMQLHQQQQKPVQKYKKEEEDDDVQIVHHSYGNASDDCSNGEAVEQQDDDDDDLHSQSSLQKRRSWLYFDQYSSQRAGPRQLESEHQPQYYYQRQVEEVEERDATNEMPEEMLAENDRTTICVSGLYEDCVDVNLLISRFAQFGPLENIEVHYLPQMVAYIKFRMQKSARKAIANTDGRIWLGNTVRCAFDEHDKVDFNFKQDRRKRRPIEVNQQRQQYYNFQQEEQRHGNKRGRNNEIGTRDRMRVPQQSNQAVAYFNNGPRRVSRFEQYSEEQQEQKYLRNRRSQSMGNRKYVNLSYSASPSPQRDNNNINTHRSNWHQRQQHRTNNTNCNGRINKAVGAAGERDDHTELEAEQQNARANNGNIRKRDSSHSRLRVVVGNERRAKFHWKPAVEKEGGRRCNYFNNNPPTPSKPRARETDVRYFN